jgi:SAM-dependent methyltransferase
VTANLRYGNWIRKKILWTLGLSALGLGLLASLPLPPVIRIGAGSLGIVMFLSFLYPLYAYYMFSPQGGNMQERIYNLIMVCLGDQAHEKILDIGTGNGVLAVKLAQRHPGSQVVGLDYWGQDWEYAKSVCEANANLAQVSPRVRFVKGDAAVLDFANAAFDAVVSNLTFHEVKSASKKSDVVEEALRVLKAGGSFAFVDYFYDEHCYGQGSKFEAFLRGLGLSKVRLEPLSDRLTIPGLLQHPKALGKVGIIYGQK